MLIDAIKPVGEHGQYPVSIATSLALESLTGIHEDHTPGEPPPFTLFDEIWINVNTVLRNYHTSMKADVAGQVTDEEWMYNTIAEMQVIKGVIDDRTQRKFACRFYYCDYTSLKKLFPGAIINKPNTDKQKLTTALYDDVSKMIVDKWKEMGETIHLIGEKQTSSYDSRIIYLTHKPVDIIIMALTGNDALLESHTGKLKYAHHWNTKFKGNNNLERIPFNKYTIQIFGDSGGMFKPMDMEYRRQLVAISEARKWDHTTTNEKFTRNIEMAGNKQLIDLIRQVRTTF